MVKLLKMIGNLAVLAALGWAAWYGYTNWVAASSDSGTAADTGGYNCRVALAKLGLIAPVEKTIKATAVLRAVFFMNPFI